MASPSPKPGTHRRVLAHHLIFTLYGHWPPNDLRGSYSREVRKPELDALGDPHFGRRPAAAQPTQTQLRGFHREVRDRLEHPVVWFDERSRGACADAFARVVASRGYTCWACAICSNHAHACVRVHRDRDRTMWRELADASRRALREAMRLSELHPVWAAWPYALFKDSPDAIGSCVGYIERNPEKEGLPRQEWPFVKAYDGWPYHKS